MPTRVVDPQHPDPAVIEQAAAALRAGELVAFPTETVYGLGARALDERAVARIFSAKGRPSHHPLIVHVLEVEQARELVREWPKLAQALADRFWPGPLTLVLPKREQVPDLVTAGLDSVALRSPAHPVARALLAALGEPIAAPSANRYQGVSPTTAAHVERSLGRGAVAWLLDGGPSTVGIESTVLDLTGERPVLLRPGGVSVAELEAITGPLARIEQVDEAKPRSSPGMSERHYAPRGRLELIDRRELEARIEGSERPLGAILLEPIESVPGIDHLLSMPSDPRDYARLLYAAMHTLDELGCVRILVERVPEHDEWTAVRDRLRRAAA